ncbi:MAG TPA: tetratricopeptide repeat protein [Thermoanaerobaculia bacterium]|jgi:tetratricopeptide (TPR) repeat protein|nr:tetratricopeptide repeat protein [Thermoanaerobaculia bacterium]
MITAVLLLSAAAAQAQFVPPVLKGIKGDGTPRQTNGPIPFPAADEKWLLARSKHFVFISSADEKRTRSVAAELETLASALTQVDSTFSAPTATPTRVILFTRRRESRPYFDMLLNRRDANVSGVFVSQREGGSMLINQDYSWQGGDRAPLHELVHYLMQSGDAHAPLWLEEGIAEYFSNATIRSRSISAGEPMPTHISVLRQRARIPLPELFGAARESDVYNLSSGQAVFYAESWAIVDWLVRTSGRNGGDFYDFVHDLAHGGTVEAALKAHYHRTLRDVDTALSRYSAPQRVAWAISLAVPATDTHVIVESLDRASTLYELGHFLSGLEELAGDAERHYRAALDANPCHARALGGLGMLRASASKYAEATEFFEKAIAADPNDVDVALSYAEALMQDQIGALAQSSDTTDDDTTRFRKARTLVQGALAHQTDPRFPLGRALGDLGTTYNVEDDVTPGIAALEQASALLPGRTDFALHLLAMYRRIGNRAKADPLFAQLDAMHKSQVSFAARAVIVRAELARANAFTHDGRLDDAAAVVRDLAANTVDPDARRDFEKQAADLTRVAAQNRQIEAYNKIVAQVNNGNYHGATKALKEFLSTANDPDIVKDAKKLQKQLAEYRP